MTNKQTIHLDIEYYGFTPMKDLSIEVEFTPDEIALMRKLVSQLGKSLYNEGLLFVLRDAAPALYNRIEVAARSELFDHLVLEAFRNDEIEFNDRELQFNFESDVKSGRFKFEPDDFTEFSEQLDPEELKAREFDTWYEEEMNKDLEYLRSRYPIDEQVEIPKDIIYICVIPNDLLP
jgi:hypothetical protein